jgi:hypothetical protein
MRTYDRDYILAECAALSAERRAMLDILDSISIRIECLQDWATAQTPSEEFHYDTLCKCGGCEDRRSSWTGQFDAVDYRMD